jgi:hypothetical protein
LCVRAALGQLDFDGLLRNAVRKKKWLTLIYELIWYVKFWYGSASECYSLHFSTTYRPILDKSLVSKVLNEYYVRIYFTLEQLQVAEKTMKTYAFSAKNVRYFSCIFLFVRYTFCGFVKKPMFLTITGLYPSATRSRREQREEKIAVPVC